MGLDDRDYMRRPAQNGRVARNAKTAFPWKQFVIAAIVVPACAAILHRLPEIQGHWAARYSNEPFPHTGAIRWYVPTSQLGVNATAPLTITGLTNANHHMAVELSNWETHAPIAIIAVRAGETANLQVPLGRYRLRYASSASWQGSAQLQGNIQEALEPMDFYRENQQIMGRHIDLNGRIDGNLKTRPTGFF